MQFGAGQDVVDLLLLVLALDCAHKVLHAFYGHSKKIAKNRLHASGFLCLNIEISDKPMRIPKGVELTTAVGVGSLRLERTTDSVGILQVAPHPPFYATP